jgi:hypothetical protein
MLNHYHTSSEMLRVSDLLKYNGYLILMMKINICNPELLLSQMPCTYCLLQCIHILDTSMCTEGNKIIKTNSKQITFHCLAGQSFHILSDINTIHQKLNFKGPYL